jgi:hypothetical protein
MALVRTVSALRLRVAVGPVSLNVGLCQPISLCKQANYRVRGHKSGYLNRLLEPCRTGS